MGRYDPGRYRDYRDSDSDISRVGRARGFSLSTPPGRERPLEASSTQAQRCISADSDSNDEKLKTALTSPAVLSKPDPKLPFELHVDASDTGIAGKLNQIEPSSDVQDESNITPTPKERLIACVSRSLSKQERKWAAHEKEALAVIWSLEKFRTYLYAAAFTIYTDHRNLLDDDFNGKLAEDPA